MLAAAALFLVGAAPASAVTGGYGVSKALRLGPAPLAMQLQQTDKKNKHQVCESPEVRTKAASYYSSDVISCSNCSFDAIPECFLWIRPSRDTKTVTGMPQNGPYAS